MESQTTLSQLETALIALNVLHSGEMIRLPQTTSTMRDNLYNTRILFCYAATIQLYCLQQTYQCVFQTVLTDPCAIVNLSNNEYL